MRVRIVVRPKDHPTYGGFRLLRYKNIKFITKNPNFVIFKIFSSGLRHFNTQRHSTLGNALYSLTLVALTIFPRKASREPMYAFVTDES